MLIEAHRVHAPWLDKVALACFAPATTGARTVTLSRLALGGLPSFFGLAYHILRHRWPSLDDLRVESPFLRTVREGTNHVINAGNAMFFSLLTLFGTYDNIIDLQDTLAFDLPYVVIPDLDHVSICKPSEATHEIYFRLRDVLSVL